MTEPRVAVETAGAPAGSSSLGQRGQWLDLLAAVLARSGRPSEDPEAALSRVTLDGIAVRPLYTAADEVGGRGWPGQAPFVRGSVAGAPGWDVRQRHAGADAGPAIRDDLANGVTSVWLDVDDPSEVADALDGVALERTPIVLDVGAAAVDAGAVDADAGAVDVGSRTLAAARAVLALDGGSGWRGNVGADPIGWAHRSGTTPDLAVVPAAMALCAGHPELRPLVVDGTVYHDAGASDADELAIVTAVGVAYLRALTDAGSAIENALMALEFRVAVTDDQFASIAKLRAARRLWNRVGELCGAPELVRGQRQHAVTSAAMMTRRDPHTNLLRSTVAAFAAAVGGAQAITVAPFDQALGRSHQALGRSDALARRIARNTQAVLHDEVSLARVADPGGGSWYVESRTEELARRAWQLFTELEGDGGATNRSRIAAMIAASRDRRDALIAAGDFPITGVNRFANETEPPPSERIPATQGIAGGLPRVRYAEADEAGWRS